MQFSAEWRILDSLSKNLDAVVSFLEYVSNLFAKVRYARTHVRIFIPHTLEATLVTLEVDGKVAYEKQWHYHYTLIINRTSNYSPSSNLNLSCISAIEFTIAISPMDTAMSMGVLP